MLVKDINTTAPSASSNPTHFANLGGKTLFRADDGVHGAELWVTDGTAAGTTLLLDILPGPTSSNLHSFESLDGRVFFSANDGVNGQELWVTDGTAAGTRLFKDISSTGSSAPVYLRRIGNSIYFAAYDGVYGKEPWVTNGTVAGTVLLANIAPTYFNSNPDSFAPLPGGKCVFTATDLVRGSELWISDGTGPGTVMLKDIHPTLPSFPTGLTAWNGRVYFAADDGTNGPEPWVTDGTAAGTTLLVDLLPGPTGSAPYHFEATKNKLYFGATDPTAGQELFETDGTAAGTKLAVDVYPGVPGSRAAGLATVGSRYTYFRADNGTGQGTEMFRTDGTLAGTVPIADIWPGPGSSFPEAISQGYRFKLHENGAILYFAAQHPTHGKELWMVDTSVHAVHWDVEPGCGTATRVPTLRGEDPVIGGVGTYDFDNLHVSSVGCLVLGVPDPTPLPAPPGCFSHVDLLQPFFVIHTWLALQPTHSVKLGIPNKPSLKGAAFALQAWFLLTNSLPTIDQTNGTFCVVGY